MKDPLYRPSLEEGYTPIVEEGNEKLKYIEFGILRLKKGKSFRENLENKEAALIILEGKFTVKAKKSAGAVGATFMTPKEWKSLERKNVFEERAYGVYIPPHSSYEISGEEDGEIAIAKSPSDLESEPCLVTPREVKVNLRGKGNFQRNVYEIIDSGIKARRLVMGETINLPGNWSSYPPHKHDVDNPPAESKLEELYFFKLNPPQGFGLIRLYDKREDKVYTVRNNDVVLIDKGYHPVAAAPGYSLYYLWILAGENRTLSPNDDPQHAWVKNYKPQD
jgi:5-deoxy-glucuronate isomerase